MENRECSKGLENPEGLLSPEEFITFKRFLLMAEEKTNREVNKYI